MLAEEGPFAAAVRRKWAAHLVAGGDTEIEAYARFAEWAREDRLFAIADELTRLRAAGFADVDVALSPGADSSARRRGDKRLVSKSPSLLSTEVFRVRD